jgi:hypothetical protein
MENQFTQERRMQLPSKDGIKCDLCGNILRAKFVYYSYDCHKVSVDINKSQIKKDNPIDVNGSIIAFDICEPCFQQHTTKMLENNNDEPI